MKKRFLLASVLATTVALTGCVSDGGNRYRSDVYSVNNVNRVQRVETITIQSVTPAQIALPRNEGQDRSEITGTIIGAIAGAAIGNHGHHSTSSRVMGGIAGAALGNLAGNAIGGQVSSDYADGVQITWRGKDGNLYQSAQVGRLCEFKVGPALLVAPNSGDARVQPNNPLGCAR